MLWHKLIGGKIASGGGGGGVGTEFDISNAVFSQTFSVASEETSPQGIAFNTDGTKMFIVGNSGDDVNEYTLGTGFDVSTASYSQNFSVSSQETSPSGIAFNADGTKMFIVGQIGDDVNEYTLGTGFDVSTATYSQNFSVSAQENFPTGMAFNNDGTKMFIIGLSGVDVNEYTLGTGFDVSTATYSQNFSVSAQESSPRGIAFNTDGTKMFIVGQDGDDVNEYTLVTPVTGFDISTAVYSQSFSVASEETNPSGIAFNSDGTKMFVIGNSGDDVNEYTLSTGFDVSTATFVDSFSVNAQETSPTGIAFNTDGTKMFIVGIDGDEVNEYTLGTGFDVSTATYSQNFSVSSQETQPYEIAFNTDGTKMFILGVIGDDVNEYTLGTGFDVSTASYSQNFSVSAQDTTPTGLAFNTDGTKMFILGFSGDDVNEYTLGTGFDVSTATYSQNFSVSAQETSPLGLAFNTDGTKMFILGFSGDTVYEYDL